MDRLHNRVYWTKLYKECNLTTESDHAFADIIVRLFFDGKTLQSISEAEFIQMYTQQTGESIISATSRRKAHSNTRLDLREHL